MGSSRLDGLGHGANQTRVAVGLCPVSVAEDPGGRLFTEEFANEMQKAVRVHTSHAGYAIEQPSLSQTQTAMSSGASRLGGGRWHLEAWSDGSVGAVYEEPDENGSPHGVRRPLHQAWALANDFAVKLGGGIDHFVSFRITGITRLQYSDGIHSVPVIKRGLIRLPDPDSPTFEHIFRELQRIGGDFAWEPKLKPH